MPGPARPLAFAAFYFLASACLSLDTNNGSGTGGSGGSGGCTQSSDCGPTESDCVLATCTGGVCGTSNAPVNTPIAQQKPGDCMIARCDGQGSVTQAPDVTDLPDDGNDCT